MAAAMQFGQHTCVLETISNSTLRSINKLCNRLNLAMCGQGSQKYRQDKARPHCGMCLAKMEKKCTTGRYRAKKRAYFIFFSECTQKDARYEAALAI